MRNRVHAQVRALFGRTRPSRRLSRFPRPFSHYDLLKEIGAGAGGTVYLARDHCSRQVVALKLLRGYPDKESRQRFLREATCASTVHDPHIAEIYEIIQNRDAIAIVMEHIPGQTLDRFISKHGLPLRISLDYAQQIAQTLAVLHKAGIIHRDLKPANFIVTKNGVVKLLDFGLCKMIGRKGPFCSCERSSNLPKTREGTILGTPTYMSPEQVRGGVADQRSDIFSFGILFYEMLTGRPPFHEVTEIDTMRAILRKAPKQLSACIPSSLRRIIRRCLAKKPESRFESGVTLLETLTQAMSSL